MTTIYYTNNYDLKVHKMHIILMNRTSYNIHRNTIDRFTLFGLVFKRFFFLHNLFVGVNGKKSVTPKTNNNI